MSDARTGPYLLVKLGAILVPLLLLGIVYAHSSGGNKSTHSIQHPLQVRKNLAHEFLMTPSGGRAR
jgi:hypothetical protein